MGLWTVPFFSQLSTTALLVEFQITEVSSYPQHLVMHQRLFAFSASLAFQDMVGMMEWSLRHSGLKWLE